MKMTKRIFSLALCLVLMMALAVPALAADGYTLTITNDKPDHIYEAYQLFAGDLSEKDSKQVLSNVVWGSAVVKTGVYDFSAAVLSAIKAEPKLSTLHEATNAATLAEELATVTSDSETIDLFAEVVGKVLFDGATKAVPAGTSGAQEGNKYTIGNLAAGYYLVKDKDGSLVDKNDVYTKFILRVLKDEAVVAKGDVPKVEKTINDTLDGTYTEQEDFNIGDTAYYKWEGTLPSNLKSYETYYYKFVDTLPAKGLKFLEIEQVYIEGEGSARVHTFFDVNDENTDNDTMPTGMDGGVNDEGTQVTLEITDLKTLYPNILPTHKIVVKYSAMVTRDALIAQPNTNNVTLTFSNDPQGDGTGTTPPNEAHAFTFRINVDKYDADDSKTKLEGAEFKLYKEKIESETKVTYYAKVITEEMIAAGENINGKEVVAADLGAVYEWTTDETQASVLDTDSNGALTVKGLDEGIYYLKETKAPAGYNLMETPVQIKIVPTYSADGKSVTVKYEVDSIEQSSDTVGVRNSSGSTLPVTGGVGTTMFYIVGGLMVAAAVVLLITKRRAEEN